LEELGMLGLYYILYFTILDNFQAFLPRKNTFLKENRKRRGRSRTPLSLFMKQIIEDLGKIIKSRKR